jgi:glycosyltransferase involved in cell wall biosynthesis
MEMQNVLVIAYYFPPMGLSGVQRTLKFVKYLPEYGWRPIVVTAGATPYYAVDETLLDEIEPLVEQGLIEIVRTDSGGAPAERFARKNGSTLKLPRASYQRFRSKAIQTFLQPDSRIRWKKAALAVIDEIYAREDVRAILSTAPPYTDFLIARDVRMKYGTPYLMDYRDAWVENPVLNFYATPFHKAYAAKLEDSCLRASDGVTVVNRRVKESLLKDYSFLTHEDVSILAHGFDQEDIERAAPFSESLASPGKFRITYSGAFYVGRSPKVFLEGAALAMQQDPALAEDLEMMFVGVLQKEYEKLIRKMGIEQNVVQKGYVNHRESVGLLLSSDVLWMTMSDDISAPGKLYEYLGTRKPILGLVPGRSQAAQLLEEYGAGAVVPPDDPESVARAILGLYGMRKQQNLGLVANEAFVQGFDRRLLTGDLARKLSHLANAHVG